MLKHYPAQVYADLRRFYAVDLDDMYSGRIRVARVAALVVMLPRGAMTWQALGGGMAVTEETQSLWAVEHALYSIAWAQGGKKGNAPTMRELPKSLEARKAETEHAQLHTDLNYEAWKRRTGRGPRAKRTP